MKKKTDRILRDEQLEDLEKEGDICLEKFIGNVAHKHKNGGIFKSNEHHKKTQRCVENELSKES